MRCTLCKSETQLFSEIQEKTYYRCTICNGIFLDSRYFLSHRAEKERYDLHQNNSQDLAYQKFVLPIVDLVLKEYKTCHKGLDFGSGKNSPIAYLLHNKKYDVNVYDLHFYNNPEVLETHYNYITCCEVMEHFYDPFSEFNMLYNILLPKGTLYCKTQLFDNRMNFDTWWYKNDPTHVFFYTKETLQWIKKQYGFASVTITDFDVIIFRK